MAIPLLASLISSAATNDSGSNPNSTPTKSAGLDPGGYAFDLWFNEQRREETQRNLDRDYRLKRKTVEAQLSEYYRQKKWADSFSRAMFKGNFK